jgi:hypothetical protein
MAKEIIYTDGVMFGETNITSIRVLPINFASFAKVWSDVVDEARGDRSTSTTALMQRARIRLQAQFMAGDKRVAPETAHILQLPLRVAKQIVDSLDIGEGPAGELLNDADGISAPVHYKLGTPLSMKINGKSTEISELEFQAKVYGDIEDVLATDGDIPRTMALIKKTATPVGADLTLTSLPSWALDRITVADGITIMRNVVPRFLE